MDQSWVGRMPEVEENEVEEVDSEQNLTQPEVAAHPEHNEAKGQRIVL